MKLEETTVVIEARSAGACLDLAVLFYRRHARALAPATLGFTLTGALVAYAAARRTEDGLLWSGLWFFMSAPLLAAVLVGASGPAVFGAPFEAARALRAESPRGAFLFSTLATRIVIAVAGLPCLGLTSIPVAVYYGFLPEVLLLERVPRASARRRVSEIVRSTFSDLLARAAVLSGFTAVAALVLFLLVDQTLFLLFGWPVLLGRLDGGAPFADLSVLLLSDPWVVALISAAVWSVYPVARLAWFFCYLDARILKEGWDLELEFRIEARRLEAIA
jgi:hypothetical protein